MVGRVGIEPTTGRLKAECSTSELTPHLGFSVAVTPTEGRRHDTRYHLNNKRLLAPSGATNLDALFLHALQSLARQTGSRRFRVIRLYASQ